MGKKDFYRILPKFYKIENSDRSEVELLPELQ